MKEYRGLYLPDDEHEIQEAMRVSPDVDGRASYQYRKLETALSCVTGFRCAVDVGAHIGTWSRHLVQRFTHVLAFEPHAEWRELWALNVRVSGGHTADVEPYALGDTSGPVTVGWAPGVSGHTYVSMSEKGTVGPNLALLAKHGEPSPDIAERPALMKTLDEYALPVCDFLKIDVEGYERFVLDGAADTIARCQPVVVVEQKAGQGSRYGVSDTAAIDRLLSWRYQVKMSISGDFILTPEGV